MLRTLLCSILLLVASLPFAPGAAAWVCTPARDVVAGEAEVFGERFYTKVYASGGFRVQEVWRETNGEEGLQSRVGMSCVGASDRMESRVCLGLCPIEM